MFARSFNIKLLCIASLFLASHTYTTPDKIEVSLDKKTLEAIKSLSAQRGSSNKAFILGAIALAEAIYIINDKDPFGIATSAKEQLKLFNQYVHSILNEEKHDQSKESTEDTKSTSVESTDTPTEE